MRPNTRHVADNRRALAQMRRNHHASLGVELAGLPVVVHAIEKLEAGGMTAGHLQQLPLELQPGREGVNSDTLSRQARDEHVGPCWSWMTPRNMVGTFNRPLSSIRVGELPRSAFCSTLLHKNPPG